jgi:DNA-directed RNA polymerase subunit beta'
MKDYTYQNNLISKKQLGQILGWTFTNYDCMQACLLADELKYIGFKYSSQAGISISIEDLKVPFAKEFMLDKANQEILNSEKIFLKGKLTEVERFQKIIDTWSLTSDSLKNQVVSYFKNYDPLNSVYIMAFSGARGNISQVRQLVGMRGLMSDPSGEIMKLPIKKNFREGLTITDYLMSGYGARKGTVDTALKTANSGYLTRRLIDVAQDIIIREKDCLTKHSIFLTIDNDELNDNNEIYNKINGLILNKSIVDPVTNILIAKLNTQITPLLITTFKEKNISQFFIRSPLTCSLYRSICQKCYGWDLANENLVDIGEAVGILAGQSIGEPGTQLTMRTFHTGGVFTSEISQQIMSPKSGVVKFSKLLKTVILRTNRGEDVRLSKNSGSLILVTDSPDQTLIKIEILRNTILFPKNNQYIQKNRVIGEVINTNKQIKREVKSILSYSAGEIIIPRLKNKVNLLNDNKLLWLLSGEVYHSPINSFINFYPDHKLNKSSFIFRAKLLNHYPGFVEFLNGNSKLYQRKICISNEKYSLSNSVLKGLTINDTISNHILFYKDKKYLIKTKTQDSKVYLQTTRKSKFANLLINSYFFSTGGRGFYDYLNTNLSSNSENNISYYLNCSKEKNINVFHRTLIWVGEENYKLNCEQSILLVKQGDFIGKDFEIIPDCLSKTSGLVSLVQKNNIIQKLIIKEGCVYQGKEFSDEASKIYYPGEQIFENIAITSPSICERVMNKNIDQLLIRPIYLYELPQQNQINRIFKEDEQFQKILKLEKQSEYIYKPNQLINSWNQVNLVSQFLVSKMEKSVFENITIQFKLNKLTSFVNIQVFEKINLKNYIAPQLKYRNLESCLLIQKSQFIDSYTVIAYLESITSKPLEIVKFKINQDSVKQILLISNDNCVKVDRTLIGTKKLNDFILDTTNINEIGKIIIENDHFVTIQKGRPYFFPNCKRDDRASQANLTYKLLNEKYKSKKIETKRKISLKSYDAFKISVDQKYQYNKRGVRSNIKFSKFFLKKNGKLYSCLVPRFFKKFSVETNEFKKKLDNFFSKSFKSYYEEKQNQIKTIKKKVLSKTSVRRSEFEQINKIGRTMLMKKSEVLQKDRKPTNGFKLILIHFSQYTFTRSTKSIGLSSITEDYFEEDFNSMFCKNNEFIDDNSTLGLLNLEKELTGDIVQGLPRIEEILEARKKNIITKRIPANKKKGLLIQKTTLDPIFEFRKIGTTIAENDKVNPHKLLKVYFNYYGLLKKTYCELQNSLKYVRLLSNSESSYRSFKKVQIFILNSVQSVYKSQGVTINDKHLEVIIKQMTTKVLITCEGDTPLLRREVIDLYHIEYINKIIKKENKKPAYYVPFLLGITKGALNNPSFISAASFQETTRVLTKAAIEGRIDWLRGLKENIIIGHLIPAGTGSRTYKTSFKKPVLQ